MRTAPTLDDVVEALKDHMQSERMLEEAVETGTAEIEMKVRVRLVATLEIE